MDQIGAYMLQIGVIAGLVVTATAGLGMAMENAEVGPGTRRKVKLWFALLSGPMGSVVVTGLGLIEIGPGTGAWSYIGAAFFGLLGTLIAMAGHDIQKVVKKAKKGKLP